MRDVRLVPIDVPDVEDWIEMLKQYDNRMIGVFDEYYIHHTDKIDQKNPIHASMHEARMAKLSKDNPEEYQKLQQQYFLRKKIWKEPDPRFGSDLRNDFSIYLKDITHSYKKSIEIEGQLYGQIEIMNTVRGRKYADNTDLLLVPVIISYDEMNQRTKKIYGRINYFSLHDKKTYLQNNQKQLNK
jgi:hypothetical protein